MSKVEYKPTKCQNHSANWYTERDCTGGFYRVKVCDACGYQISTSSAYDGGEPGSTDAIENVELPVGETVNQQTLQTQTKILH